MCCIIYTYVCCHSYICMMHTCLSSFMCLVPVEAEEGISTPGTRVTDECSHYFMLKIKPSLLEEQIMNALNC